MLSTGGARACCSAAGQETGRPDIVSSHLGLLCTLRLECAKLRLHVVGLAHSAHRLGRDPDNLRLASDECLGLERGLCDMTGKNVREARKALAPAQQTLHLVAVQLCKVGQLGDKGVHVFKVADNASDDLVVAVQRAAGPRG